MLAALAGGLAAAAGGQKPEADARKAEAELQAVKSEIERVTRQVSGEQVERDRLTRDLKSAELSVGHVRESLSEVKHQRAEHAARRTALATEQRERAAQLEKNRVELAGQMRAAYTLGRQEPLKLLLNQQDPALAGRMFAYYGYFGRARAGQIKIIEDDVQRLAELAAELDAEDAELARLEQQQRAELSQLEHARAQRSQVLAGLRPSRARARRTSSGCALSRPDSSSCCASCVRRWSASRSRPTRRSRACAASSRGR
jgi:septal ring factor EnvC (AmiA/AmiB activator)